MQMTMRWFGPEEDKISLEHIRRCTGVEGVVGALYDVAVGEVWPVDKIERLVGQAHAAGLKMEVIESVNIHDDIKIGLPTRERYIANYQQTIRNLARFGVKVICYNFMPVFDWMKTDMNYVLPDGSLTMAFEKKDIDKRLEDVVKEVLENSNGFALPGWEPERLAEVQTLFAKYSAVDDQKLRENLGLFSAGGDPGLRRGWGENGDPPGRPAVLHFWPAAGGQKPRRSGLDLPGRRFTRQRHYALHRLDCRRS